MNTFANEGVYKEDRNTKKLDLRGKKISFRFAEKWSVKINA